MPPVAKPARFHWWYESAIDWMLANPQGTLRECAKAMGCSENWFYTVAASDAFKARYEERRRELTNALNDSIANRLGRVAEKGLKIIETRLDSQETAKLPTSLVVDMTDRVLSRMGWGVTGGGSNVTVNVQQNNGQLVQEAASRQAIEEARAFIRRAPNDAAGVPEQQLDLVPTRTVSAEPEPNTTQLELEIEPPVKESEPSKVDPLAEVTELLGLKLVAGG